VNRRLRSDNVGKAEPFDQEIDGPHSVPSRHSFIRAIFRRIRRGLGAALQTKIIQNLAIARAGTAAHAPRRHPCCNMRRKHSKGRSPSSRECGSSPTGCKGRSLVAAKEEDIYRALGLRFIDPERREGRSEIERALKGKLPKPPPT
jgi:hypothetical protein